MQEWIIGHARDQYTAVLRDMAKTICQGEKSAKNAEVFALCENHPRKEKVEKYAESFSETGGQFLRDALPQGPAEQRTDRPHPAGRQRRVVRRVLSQRDLLGRTSQKRSDRAERP